MSFQDDESWTSCNWFSEDDKDLAACKQTPGIPDSPLECRDRSEESRERFLNMTGGIYNPNTCQLLISNVNYNYTGSWTIQIHGGENGQGTNKTEYIQIQTTRLAEVTGDPVLSVTSGHRFKASCEASFGVPKTAGSVEIYYRNKLKKYFYFYSNK